MHAKNFCIVIFTFLLILTGGQRELVGQAAEKPAYKFEDTRTSEADTLMSQKHYAEALVAYQNTLTTYNDELFYEGMVYTTERIAHCYRRLRKDSLSAATFQKAINLAKTKLEPNHMLLSKAYLNNGIRAHYRGVGKTASYLLDSAMWAYENSSWQSPKIQKAVIHFKFYTYYYSSISVDTLIKYAFKKQEIFDFKNANINEEIVMITDFSRAFYTSGDYSKSVAYCLKALEKAEPNLDNVKKSYYESILFNLARSLDKLSNSEKALQITNKLIKYTLNNNPKSKELMAYLNLKALSLVSLKRFNEARTLYNSIINSPNFSKIRDSFIINTIQNLGISYMLEDDFEKAFPYLFKSLEFQKKAQSISSYDLSIRYYYLGAAYNKTHDYERALLYYDSAIREIIPSYQGALLDLPNNVSGTLSSTILNYLKKKAQMLLKLYSQHSDSNVKLIESAFEYSDFTHQHIVKNRDQTSFEDSKLFLTREYREIYEVGIHACNIQYQKIHNLIYISQALQTMSRSKSLLFHDQVNEYNIISNKLLPDSLYHNFSIAKTSIDSLNNFLNQQIAIDPLGDSVMVLNSEKMQWNAKLAGIRKIIEEDYPETENELLNEEVSLASLREDHQLSDQKALVEYFVGDSVIFVIGLSGKKESFHRVKKDKVLDEALSGFLGEVNTAPDLSELEVHLQRFGQSASRLYQALLQPVLNDLGDVSELVIVPDEILSRVPFEMLLSDWSGHETSFKELKYLLKDIKVSHLLSSKVSFNAPVENQGKGFLGFGYVGDDIVDERAEMGGLPGALKEINFLKSNFKGDYYMGKEGTKRQFLKKASDYDVIHLALHGKSDSVNRYNSALVFNGERDFYMTSTDLYRTRLKSKLAVLSACESGIGKISEGEGSFSIARGFAIAGVPSIVTTLWRVNDEAGAAITQQFYLNLSAGDKKDEALRKAKLQYLETSDNLTASPYFWGSYILIGDTSTIELPERNSLPWYWVLFTVVFLTGMGIGLRRLSRKPFDQAA